MKSLSSNSDYVRMMLFRGPNPDMRTCRMCHRRTAVGQACCSARLVYDSSDGPARRVRDTDGQMIYVPRDYWIELKRKGRI